MKKSLSALALIMSVMTAPAVFATERTVTFAIDNMTCASCPYIVKTSMAAVPGVSTVAVSSTSPSRASVTTQAYADDVVASRRLVTVNASSSTCTMSPR